MIRTRIPGLSSLAEVLTVSTVQYSRTYRTVPRTDFTSQQTSDCYEVLEYLQLVVQEPTGAAEVIDAKGHCRCCRSSTSKEKQQSSTAGIAHLFLAAKANDHKQQETCIAATKASATKASATKAMQTQMFGTMVPYTIYILTVRYYVPG